MLKIMMQKKNERKQKKNKKKNKKNKKLNLILIKTDKKIKKQ